MKKDIDRRTNLYQHIQITPAAHQAQGSIPLMILLDDPSVPSTALTDGGWQGWTSCQDTLESWRVYNATRTTVGAFLPCSISTPGSVVAITAHQLSNGPVVTLSLESRMTPTTCTPILLQRTVRSSDFYFTCRQAASYMFPLNSDIPQYNLESLFHGRVIRDNN